MWIFPRGEPSLAGAVFADSFTDANGTHVPPHTPEIGGPWTAGGGTPQIQGNAFTGPTGDNLVRANCGVGDFTMDFDAVGTFANPSDLASVSLKSVLGGPLYFVAFDGASDVAVQWFDGTATELVNVSFQSQPLPAHITLRSRGGQKRLTLLVNGIVLIDTICPSAVPWGTVHVFAEARPTAVNYAIGIKNLVITSP